MGKWRKEDLTERIISACIEVHKELGPGFLESIYHKALIIEFENQELAAESEREVRVKYRNREVGIHKIDLFVEDEVVVELKTVDELNIPAERGLLRGVRYPLTSDEFNRAIGQRRRPILCRCAPAGKVQHLSDIAAELGRATSDIKTVVAY